MFTDKLTLAIAEAAKKCMDEDLVGNQHKIDANKNGKIDADDFKKLRKEELKGNQHKIDANKNGKIDADDFKKLRKEEIVNEEEGTGYVAFSHDGRKADIYANSSYEAHRKAIKHFDAPKSKYHMVHVHLAKKGGKDVVHTATESVNEAAIDDLRDRQAAAREANPFKAPAKKQDPTKRTVQGSQYGGTKQKDEKEVDESVQIDELSKKTLNTYTSAARTAVVKHMNDYTNSSVHHGDVKTGEKHLAKAVNRSVGLRRATDKITKEEVEQIDELSTSTLDNYRTKANSSGYNSKTTQQKLDNRSKGMNLAWSKTMPAKNDEMNPNKAKVKAGDYRFNKEEVEESMMAEDFLSESEKKLAKIASDIEKREGLLSLAAEKRRMSKSSRRHFRSNAEVNHENKLRDLRQQHDDLKKSMSEQVEVLDESKAHIEQHLADRDINAKVTGKTVKVHSSDLASAKKHVAKAGYKDHKVVGGLNEEKMSDEDMEQREKMVKGMKKNLQGFKARYGDDAEKVMYATATKQAMKEEWKNMSKKKWEPYGKRTQKHLDDLHNDKSLVKTGETTMSNLGNTKAVIHNFDHKDHKTRDHSYDRDTRQHHFVIHHNGKPVAHAMHDSEAGGITATHAKTGKVSYHSDIDDATKHFKKMHVSKLKEEVKDKYDEGEYDREGDMAKSDLRSIIANAQKLHDMIEDADNLPEWVQSKITKSEDYISTVANYMTSEMSEEVEQIDELSKNTLGSYVKKASDRKAIAAVGMMNIRDPDSDKHMDKFQKRNMGIKKAVDKLTKEEVEQIDELSKNTLGSYVKKAEADRDDSIKRYNSDERDAQGNKIRDKDLSPARKAIDKMMFKRSDKRIAGLKTANAKLAKEEVEELDEISKATLGSYVKKASADSRNKALDVGSEMTSTSDASVQSAIKKFNKSAKRVKGISKAVDKLTKEEVTNDQFKAELEDNKAKAAGTKKQPDVAKASVQSVKQESFSEKLSMLKEGVRSYLKDKNNG